MQIVSPCYKCKKRHLGCHDRCGDYQLYCCQNEELKAKKRKENNEKSAYYEMTMKNSRNYRKRT